MRRSARGRSPRTRRRRRPRTPGPAGGPGWPGLAPPGRPPLVLDRHLVASRTAPTAPHPQLIGTGRALLLLVAARGERRTAPAGPTPRVARWAPPSARTERSRRTPRHGVVFAPPGRPGSVGPVQGSEDPRHGATVRGERPGVRAQSADPWLLSSTAPARPRPPSG